MAPSSIVKASNIVSAFLTSTSILTSFSDSPVSYQEDYIVIIYPCACIGPTVITESSPHLKIPTLTVSSQSFLPQKVNYS